MKMVRRGFEISVWLGSEPTELRNRFHCPYCGKVTAEFHGDVIQMVRGAAQSETGTRGIVVMCPGCKAKITFLD